MVRFSTNFAAKGEKSTWKNVWEMLHNLSWTSRRVFVTRDQTPSWAFAGDTSRIQNSCAWRRGKINHYAACSVVSEQMSLKNCEFVLVVTEPDLLHAISPSVCIAICFKICIFAKPRILAHKLRGKHAFPNEKHESRRRSGARPASWAQKSRHSPNSDFPESNVFARRTAKAHRNQNSYAWECTKCSKNPSFVGFWKICKTAVSHA